MVRQGQVIDRRGLAPEQEDEAWKFYEETGSMAAVADRMQIPMHRVRYVLMRDPIRLAHIRACRAEMVAQKWEDKGDQSAKLAGDLLNVMEAMLKHIKSCQDEGRITDLVDKDGEPLTVTGAYQWILAVRSLDMVQKVGMTAAKVAEGLRSLHNHDYPNKHQVSNPNQLSDEELRDIVDSLRAAGRPVPWGLQTTAQKVLPEGISTE